MSEDERSIILYRLDELKDDLSQLLRNFEEHKKIEAIVDKLKYEVESLQTTRNRLITWLSGVSITAVAALLGVIVR